MLVCALNRGSSPGLSNTPVPSTHSLFSTGSRGTSSQMPVAKAMTTLLIQSFRRYLSVKSPPRRGCFTFKDCVTCGLEQNSAAQLEVQSSSVSECKLLRPGKTLGLRVSHGPTPTAYNCGLHPQAPAGRPPGCADTPVDPKSHIHHLPFFSLLWLIH